MERGEQQKQDSRHMSNHLLSINLYLWPSAQNNNCISKQSGQNTASYFCSSMRACSSADSLSAFSRASRRFSAILAL